MKLWCIAVFWACLGTAAHSAPACPYAAEIEPDMLVGRWRIEWTDGARQRGEAPWLLELGPHPEYAGSLKGSLNRGEEHHLVVADWDDEALTMEESVDGQRIAATWQATATPGQCGRELRGLRLPDSAPDASARRFRMRRLP
jgi:hypothetical protein